MHQIAFIFLQALFLFSHAVSATEKTTPSTKNTETKEIGDTSKPVGWESSAKFQSAFQGPFFWQGENETHRRLYEEMQIVVSLSEKKQIHSMKGAGIVKAPCDFSMQQVLDFSLLKKNSNHFEVAEWDEGRRHLKLKLKTQLLKESFLVEVGLPTSLQKKDANLSFQKAVPWRILSGPFATSEGQIRFQNSSSDSSDQCEVILLGASAESISWYLKPAFILAAESLLQHVASSLRKQIQEAYLQRRPEKSSPKTSRNMNLKNHLTVDPSTAKERPTT